MIKTFAFEEQSHLFPALYVSDWWRIMRFSNPVRGSDFKVHSLQSEAVSSSFNYFDLVNSVKLKSHFFTCVQLTDTRVALSSVRYKFQVQHN